jgi:thiol-disulfide isomerase/thioredoxin
MNSTGLTVAVAVLVLATAVGLWRRRTDGRLRPVGAVRASTTAAPGERPVGSTATATVPLPDGVGGAAVRGSAVSSGAGASAMGPSERIDAALLTALGVRPAQATLLQFSSAFCAPCRAVRRISGEVAGMLPGVQHVEVDAESHLDAVRALGIWRTPTLLVLDADGRVVRRATGVPGKPHLIAALAEILPAA